MHVFNRMHYLPELDNIHISTQSHTHTHTNTHTAVASLSLKLLDGLVTDTVMTGFSSTKM